MKYSRYNVWAELEGHVGLFNGLTGAFAVMTPDDPAAVDAFVDADG